MLEDRIEHRSGVFGEIGHERSEFAVEVAEKQQRLLAQNRKARVVNRADGIVRLEKFRHQWWKLLCASAFASAGDFNGKPRVKWFWFVT